VVVGPTIQRAVIRAVYTEVNARPQTIALGLGGPIEYISDEEGALRDKAGGDESRAWDLWKPKGWGNRGASLQPDQKVEPPMVPAIGQNVRSTFPIKTYHLTLVFRRRYPTPICVFGFKCL